MMQSNIFAKAAPLLQGKKFNIDCDTILDFLGAHYKSGEWVYPAALHRSLKLSVEDAYSVMEACLDAGIVEQNLQVYCPCCQKFTGSFYKSLFDIPEEVNCINCDSEISDPTEHAIVVYKVL